MIFSSWMPPSAPSQQFGGQRAQPGRDLLPDHDHAGPAGGAGVRSWRTKKGGVRPALIVIRAQLPAVAVHVLFPLFIGKHLFILLFMLLKFTGETSDSEKIEQITSYLFMLLEQLRYSLSNLDKDNFNEAGLDEIGNIPYTVCVSAEMFPSASRTLLLRLWAVCVSSETFPSTWVSCAV